MLPSPSTMYPQEFAAVEPSAERRATRAPLLGAAANTVLAALKIVGGVFGHSYALVADGIESCGDIASSLVVWAGLRVATKPADKDHPYGHGKAETIAAVISALALLAAGTVIGLESIERIRTPHELPRGFTLLILALAVGAKLVLSRVVEGANREVESTALKSDALHHVSDAMTSGAAFVGISIALIGGPGWESADDWAALIACVVVLFNGSKLLLTAVGEVMDVAGPPSVEQGVRELAKQAEGVQDVEKCLIRKSGLNYLVDMHVVVDGNLTVAEGHRIAHRVEGLLRASRFRIAATAVHVEPREP